MAFPFGGHPKLADFLEVAKQQKCEWELTTRTSRDKRSYGVLVIRNEAGARLVIVNPDFEERLAPSVVSNYQRRLGISTRFASMPEQPTSSSVTYVAETSGSKSELPPK